MQYGIIQPLRDVLRNPGWRVLLAVVLPFSLAEAQIQDSLKIGERVRIDDTHSAKIIGNLNGWSADAVFIERTDPARVITVPRLSISAVYRSRGIYGNTGNGIFLGFATGTILAALLALSTESGDLGGGTVFLLSEVVLALPIALLGGIIGTGVRTDTWESAVLPPSADPPVNSDG
jgi:hypothetical protein